jgi:hypothetical protein
MMDGYRMQLARPSLESNPYFDIREPEQAKKVLNELGIDKVIIRSILGGTAEVLPFLVSLGFPIEYKPSSAESVCPRLDCRRDGQYCNGGWREDGTCQECLSSFSSPFGAVDPLSWRIRWGEFLKTEGVTYDTSQVPEDFRPPLDEVHAIIDRAE